MVATSDFSGFEISHCALASAAASAAIDSLDRCMARLRLEHVETDCAGLRPTRTDAVPNRFLGVFGHEFLELCSCAFVLSVSLARPQIDPGELGPAVRLAHVDHPRGLDPRTRRLNAEYPGRLAALDTSPEFSLRRD